MAREMKDSGIEWIGEIPVEWKTANLRHVFSFGKGLPITKENLRETGVPVISYGQIHSKGNNGITVKPELIRYVDESYLESNPESLVQKGDFIFADTSEDLDGCGNSVFVDTEDPLFAGYHTIILRNKGENDNRYFAFLFQSGIWRKQIRGRVSGVKVFSISQRILRDSSLLVPPCDEQSRIADLLTRKCNQIDSVINHTRASIEEYKKLKQAVITQAVTKGIRPDRQMKDSGVEWIGVIPADWIIRPLKSYIDILPGYAFSSDDFDTESGIALLRGINVAPDAIRWDDVVFWNKEITEQLKSFELAENDLVVGLDRPWISEGTRVAFVSKKDLPCLLLQRVCRIRPKDSIDIRFVYHAIAGKAFEEALSTDTTGVSVPHISTKQIQNYLVAIPPLNEQKEICDYLYVKCSKIDNLIEKKMKLLSDLEFYKKSLIYEYVTGKKEVPA